MESNVFIQVDDAKRLLAEVKTTLVKEKLTLEDALGCVLAKDICSSINSPPFSQSTRDGYALVYDDVKKGRKITIAGEVKAGDDYKKPLSAGQSVRIFTGAPVPAGADAVVMQEHVSVSGKILGVKKDDVTLNGNINPAGSQCSKGGIALKKGAVLTPATIGYLSGLGVKYVEVYKEPRISILVTGNELQQAGKKLKSGGIYDAVSPMLASALKSTGYAGEIKIMHGKDSLPQLTALFKKTLKESDIVITTGGISVGDYDYMSKVFGDSGVKTIFYKVRQRPGKPLYYGKYKNTFVFGLPGNPAAVLSCFYEYVNMLVKKMKGYTQYMPALLFLPLSKELPKKKGLAFFLKAVTDYKSVTLLPNQESYYLDSFAQANCLVYIPEDKTTVNQNELVEVHLLP